MKLYQYYDAPLEVHGLPFYAENHRLERLTDADAAALRAENPESGVLILHRRTPGARVCFQTDAPQFTVRMELEKITPDVGMSIFACQSVTVLIGPHQSPRFAGLVNPPNYTACTAEKTFKKPNKMEDITLLLPRNEHVVQLEVEVPDDARVEAPTPYRYAPILFYGSSITEGGCCCHAPNAYTHRVSSMLGADYYNFGFSGSARGELALADCINRIPMSVFVYDYDHNAPDPAHLARTHEPFFRRIRATHPELPIVMLTRPVYEPSSDADARYEIIAQTYRCAVESGDRNVWLIDGRTFFGADGACCSCDGCHPNDLGFYRMAQRVEPVLRQILESRYGK